MSEMTLLVVDSATALYICYMGRGDSRKDRCSSPSSCGRSP